MPKVGPDHPIAREIRAARAYAGMSRAQVGDAIGVSRETIGDWERGDFTRLQPQPMLAAIAQATKLPVKFDLVTETPATPSVSERARLAAQRLADIPGASSETGGARDAGDGAQ